MFDDRTESVAVHPRGAPHAAQNGGAGDVVEHADSFLVRGRRQAESRVLHHLDHDAAHAEGDQLAETGIGNGTDDDLVCGAQHALHLHAVDRRAGLVVGGVRHDRRVALLDLGSRVEPGEHAAGVRLVENVRGSDLEHYGKADLLRQFHRLVSRGRQAFLGRRNAVRLANPLPFLGRQGAAPIRPHLIENCSYRGLIVAHGSSPQGW